MFLKVSLPEFGILDTMIHQLSISSYLLYATGHIKTRTRIKKYGKEANGGYY
jgi:hypothetical protein